MQPCRPEHPCPRHGGEHGGAIRLDAAEPGRLTDRAELWYRCDAVAARAWAAAWLPEGLAVRTRGPWAYWRVEAARYERVRSIGAGAAAGFGFAAVSYGLAVSAMTRGIDVRCGLWGPRLDVSAEAAPEVAGSLLGAIAPVTAAQIEPQPGGAASGFRVAGTTRGRGDATLRVVDRGDDPRPRLQRVVVDDHPDTAGTPVAVDAAAFAWFGGVGLAGGVHLERAWRWSGGGRVWRPTPTEVLLSDRPPAAAARAAAERSRAEVA